RRGAGRDTPPLGGRTATTRQRPDEHAAVSRTASFTLARRPDRWRQSAATGRDLARARGRPVSRRVRRVPALAGRFDARAARVRRGVADARLGPRLFSRARDVGRGDEPLPLRLAGASETGLSL